MRIATPRRNEPKREMRWERWATAGHVKNWAREVTEKIKPTSVVEALNSSFMYKGKKGPKQPVIVADHAILAQRKARKAKKEAWVGGGGLSMVLATTAVAGVGGRGGGRSLGTLLARSGFSLALPARTLNCMGLGWCS
jgi:hypothetical protein